MPKKWFLAKIGSFWHFLIKIFKNKAPKSDYLPFLKKKKQNRHLGKFDIKNEFSDSFPFQKCTHLYTLQLQFKSYHAVYFFKFFWWTPALKSSKNAFSAKCDKNKELWLKLQYMH